MQSNKSSRQRCLVKKAVLKSFANFTGKQESQSCFPVNIAKFLRTLPLKNICKRLSLDVLLGYELVSVTSVIQCIILRLNVQF